MLRSFVTLALAIALQTWIAVLPVHADTIMIQDSGGTDPNTLGFTGSTYGSPAPGSASDGNWDVSGPWCCGYDVYSLNSIQVAELDSASSWTYTATFANLSTNTSPEESYPSSYTTVPGSYGSYASIALNGFRFDLGLHADGSGDQILMLDPFSGGPDYTISGLGTNQVTLSLVYNNSTDTADVYVDGVDVISGLAGNQLSDSTINELFFGGEDGQFSNVELSYAPLSFGGIGDSSPVPEPRTFWLILFLTSIAVFFGRRRVRA